MKILQQCIYFPPEVGGLESHVYYLCRELVRRGHEVTMVTSLSKPGTARDEEVDGVQVVRRWFPGKNPAGWMAHTVVTIPSYLPLARDADILHGQTFASSLPGIIAKHLFRKPLVITLHTSHFLRMAKQKRWQGYLRWIIRQADWLLAASVEIRDVALGLYPHPRAEALTNGVDTEIFRPVPPTLPREPGRYRLIVPRRLYKKNGVEFLVRAMPLIRQELDVEAALVGDGPERPRLTALARELDMSDHVRFLGARPNIELPGLLCSADVAVVPSLVEATSVAALEAMSCELPVAASRVGGLPEIVDQTVGTLFEPGNPPDLAASVLALLRRPDRAALGAHGRERVVAGWSVSRLARRHEEIYRTLLSEKR